MRRLAVGIWAASCSSSEIPLVRPGEPIDLVAVTPRPLVPIQQHHGPGNVLLFLADDVGLDRLGAWEVGEDVARTPTIDGLVADGVRYTRVWSQSVCSPGRAAIQTGRQPYQTGIGHALPVDSATSLEPDEITFPELISEATGGAYSSAYVGKWHLSSQRLPDGGYYRHPTDQGWGSFAGLMVGLDGSSFDGLPQTAWDWERTVDGVPGRSTTYVTTANADDAIAAIRELPEPWIVEVAFFAAHAPVHWPPDELWSGEVIGTAEDQQMTNAMIEAMDTEIARVLAALGPDRRFRTTVVFTADNGTETRAVGAPYDVLHAKGTPYEGGLRVPLVVSGYQVGRRGETCDHLVQTSDLFASIAELAGVALDPERDVDSVSFVPTLSDPAAPPARAVAFAEEFHPSGEPPYTEHFVTIRDDRYKYVRWVREPDSDEGPLDLTMFFDVGMAAVEGPELLRDGLDPEQQRAYDKLVAQLPTSID